MLRRLLAIALAFVVIGGPLAGEICEAACADHAGHSRSGQTLAYDATLGIHHSADHVSHAAHHHPAPNIAVATTAGAMSRVLHRCEPSDATLITESRDDVSAPMAKALVTTARAMPVLVELSPSTGVASRHRPPTPVRSTSPLGI